MVDDFPSGRNTIDVNVGLMNVGGDAESGRDGEIEIGKRVEGILTGPYNDTGRLLVA